MEGNNITEIHPDVFSGFYWLDVDFGDTRQCSCQVLYVIHRSQEAKRNIFTYNCSIPASIAFTTSYRNQHLVKDIPMIRNVCASDQWSTWTTSLWKSNVNCSIKYARECIRLFSNVSCTGLSSRIEPCGSLHYASTRYIHGNVIVKDAKMNTKSTDTLNKMKNKAALNAFLVETIKFVFNNHDVQVKKLMMTYLNSDSSILNASFSTKVGTPLSTFEGMNPVKIGLKQLIITKQNTVFLVTLSQRNDSKEFDDCQSNIQICDKNADCFDFTNTIAYACRCKDGYVGNGFHCKTQDIDECRENNINCHANADCVRFMDRNGYTCKCKEGFDGDGFLCKPKDVGRCQENNITCHANAECVKLMDRIGYTCKCKQGFNGDGFSCEHKSFKSTAKNDMMNEMGIATIILSSVLAVFIVTSVVCFIMKRRKFGKKRNNKPVDALKLKTVGKEEDKTPHGRNSNQQNQHEISDYASISIVNSSMYQSLQGIKNAGE